VARRYNVAIIEDDAYGFVPVTPATSFYQLAPEITYHVAGLAKCLGAGLRLAYMLAPSARAALQLTAALRASTVMATEWASHGSLVAHTTPDLLNPIWDVFRQDNPTDAVTQDRLQNASADLHELEVQRHLRHLSGEQSLPGVFWPVLVIGSIVLIVFSYFFRVERVRVQVVMTGLVAGMLSLVLLLIFSLNAPFTGPVPVSQQPLQHALLQFDAIDLPATTP
jgi:4-amino-4-deoxy-L-arabinose transferase-like glycosyltransferase